MGGRVNCYEVCQDYFRGFDPGWPDDPYRGTLEAVEPDARAWD
jgi:hypothetical protein